jgi:ABC-2 type transport system ATP-binding protein
MSIVVENITKVYGSQKALDDVTFRIGAGEVVGLLGPNGAGKSTLMKIITCFIPPTSGMVKVYGNDILEHSLEVRRKIGYLPENNPLYSDLYVREYLEFVAGIYRVSDKKKAVAEMIGITGLKTEQNKKIGMLSKGFRQRVGLAQALIHNPDVLILDEPTSGLDPNQLIEIRNLIRETGREKTVLLSTHIMQEVEAVCSRAIIIDRGKIVADDSTANLSANTKGKITVLVEFNNPVNLSQLQALPGVIAVRRRSGNAFELDSDHEDIRELVFRFAVENSLSVLSMQKSEKGLEEVFQQLTRERGED